MAVLIICLDVQIWLSRHVVKNLAKYIQGCIFPSEIKTFPWCARKFSKLFRNFNFKITVISRLKTGSGRLFSNYHSTFEKKFWFPKICEFFKKCYTFKAKFMNFFEKIVKTFPEISQISKLCRDDYHRRMWNMHPWYKIWQILKSFAGTFHRAPTLKLGGVQSLH